MTFEQFEALATGDPIVLTLALSLLLDNGKSSVSDWDSTEMSIRLHSQVPILAISKCGEIMTTAKELAAIEANDLMAYLKFSSIPAKNPGTTDEEGVCPICKSHIEYGNDEPLDNGGVIEWECPECGATGKEGYDKVFDHHYNVCDGNGNPL